MRNVTKMAMNLNRFLEFVFMRNVLIKRLFAAFANNYSTNLIKPVQSKPFFKKYKTKTIFHNKE